MKRREDRGREIERIEDDTLISHWWNCLIYVQTCNVFCLHLWLIQITSLLLLLLLVLPNWNESCRHRCTTTYSMGTMIGHWFDNIYFGYQMTTSPTSPMFQCLHVYVCVFKLNYTFPNYRVCWYICMTIYFPLERSNEY